MKPQITISQCAWLVVSATLLAVVLVARHRDSLAVSTGDAELERLRAERQRLAEFTPAAVQAARTSAEALAESGSMPAHWPQDWSAAPVPPAAASTRPLWRIIPDRTPTWAELSAAVTSVAAAPGNRIVSLEVRSRGTLTEREIASVEILLEQPTPTPSRRNPSGGTGLPGVGVPATPPAVEAGRSLRRPAASAEPAAAGQASAPVRPDPRGPRAGSFPTKNPQPNQP